MAASALRIRSMTFSASRGQKAMPMLAVRNTSCWLSWNGAADLGEQRARQLRDRPAVVGIGRQPVDEQRELIARQAADHGLLRQRARQALGQHLEHAVAGSRGRRCR